MTTIISSRNLLQVTDEWPVVKFTAEFHVEGAEIKPNPLPKHKNQLAL